MRSEEGPVVYKGVVVQKQSGSDVERYEYIWNKHLLQREIKKEGDREIKERDREEGPVGYKGVIVQKQSVSDVERYEHI